MSKQQFDTRLIHAGLPQVPLGGAVVTPVFQSAITHFEGEGDYHDIRYIRLNNTPNHLELHAKLAALEGAEAAVVTASGMAAITTALLTVLRPGDHALFCSTLYGGTHDFVTMDLPGLGIEVDFVDPQDRGAWEAARRENTRLLYLESLTNPLLEVPDLEGAVAFCREHGLVSMVDNTFPSPFNFRPAELGFDLSLHSATKYLNGHSDLVAGAAIGQGELVERVRRKLAHLGGSLDPHACFLLCRGIKTLAVRMRHHNHSALVLARLLTGHGAVASVHHPGLEEHPQHERAARLFDGASGMLSFELHGGVEAADRMINTLKIPIQAPSLGGVESLVTRPATTSHSGMSAEARAASGIADGLVRVSVGLEDAGDLVADFEAALGA
jgi:cystathionine beta-lyase/cystathionine gamma-synthase